MSDPVLLSPADLDAACAPLLEQVRQRRVVSPAELTAIIPPADGEVWAWLSCYGQCRAWLAMPDVERDTHAEADAIGTSAISEAPIPVDGMPGWYVYPKSLYGMLQLRVLDTQLDRLTARLVRMVDDDATLADVDGAVAVASAVSYATQLLAWAWTTPGYGLPFPATEAEPMVPEPIVNLGPAEILAIATAAHRFTAGIAAMQVLTDPAPARDGGKRPSWVATLEAIGAALHIDPRELAVSHSLAKVLSLATLSADRQRVAEPTD